MTTTEAQGYRLTYYRVAANVSRLDLAAQTGITPNTLRCWERGDTTIKCSVLPDLCTALGVTPNDLVAPKLFDPAERMRMVAETSRLARKDDAACAELTDGHHGRGGRCGRGQRRQNRRKGQIHVQNIIG